MKRRVLAAGAIAVALTSVAALLSDRTEDSRRAPSGGPGNGATSDMPPGALGPIAPQDSSKPSSGPPAAPATIRVVGRVVAEGRTPVPGANVSVRADGAPLVSGATSDAGSFALDVRAGADEVLVVVRDARGGRARRLAFHAPPGARDLDTGAIFLTPARELVVHVIVGSAPVPGARVVIGHEAGGTFTPEAEATTGADGSATVDAVTRTTLVAYAAAAGHGRGSAVAERDDADVTVRLEPECVVEVEAVDADTGAPVPGARFEVCEAKRGRGQVLDEPCACLAAVPPTDASGRTAIHGLGSDVSLALRAVRAPGYPALLPDARVVVPAGARRVRLELPPPRTVRWPLASWGDARVPPDGTQVRLRPRTVGDPFAPGLEHAEGRIEGGALVVDGLPPHHLNFVAETEAGHVAGVVASATVHTPDPVAFFLPRSVRVRVRDAHGPVRGVGIALRLRGASRAMAGPVLTDGRGVAVLDRLFPHPVGDPPEIGFSGARVECLPFPPSRDGCRDVASLDLGHLENDVDVVLAPEEEVVLKVSVAGRPGLPSWYSIRAAGVRTVPKAEDAATGTIRLRARRIAADAPWPLRFWSFGRPPVTIDLNEAGAPAQIDLR